MSSATTPPRRRPASLDEREAARFGALAKDWWDPDGPMAPLHRINPVRIGFVRDEICRHFAREIRSPFPLEGLDLLDIGCGAGLLSEPMARLGASVTGIDPAPANVAAARAHAEAGGLAIDYRAETVEAVVEGARDFDVVLALEVVEHVADVPAFLAAFGKAVRPGGIAILSTLNRTLRSFALAIVGAEYVLRWLPRGTHDWERFVTPRELADGLGKGGLADTRTRGLVFDPLRREWRLADDTAVNYFATAVRPLIL